MQFFKKIFSWIFIVLFEDVQGRDRSLRQEMEHKADEEKKRQAELDSESYKKAREVIEGRVVPFTVETYRDHLQREIRSNDNTKQFELAKRIASKELRSEEKKLLQQQKKELSDAWSAEHVRVRDEYKQRLPICIFSRCPYCGTLVKRQIDIFDLFGSWWMNGVAASNLDPSFFIPCPHLFVVQGGLNLHNQSPYTFEETQKANRADFIRPGPDVPFIIPRLMKLEGMKAVIHSISIAQGKYTAYVIAYFADPRPPQFEGTPDWLDKAYYPRPGRWVIRNDKYEYELGTYIDSGQVGWLDANNLDLPVRFGKSDECPYYNLSGKRERQLIGATVRYFGNPTGEPPFEHVPLND